jgi:hypothetical protein
MTRHQPHKIPPRPLPKGFRRSQTGAGTWKVERIPKPVVVHPATGFTYELADEFMRLLCQMNAPREESGGHE